MQLKRHESAIAVITDTAEAEISYMPEQVLKLGTVGQQLTAVEIAGLLSSLQL